MIARCIQKVKKDNVTIGYKLINLCGNTTVLKPKELKEAIKSNRLIVVNLKITANNRIVSTEKIGTHEKIMFNNSWITKLNTKKALYFKSNANIDNIKQKALIIGSSIRQLDNDVYVLENQATIGLISDKQLTLRQNCENLFSHTMFTNIDLNGLDSSKVENMSSMFYNCKAKKINISNFNTSKVEVMDNMFMNCEVNELDLSNFNTSKVVDMRNMFNSCKLKSLDVSSFNTSKVKDMAGMFLGLKLQKLDLTSFDTRNVEDMTSMFRSAEINELDLSSFVTDSIDINSFPAGGFTDMFLDSKVNIKAKDKRIQDEYANSLTDRHSEFGDVVILKFNDKA